MRLVQATDNRANCFDALRLLGALLVLVSHAYALTNRTEPHFGATSLGGLGVYIFFGISGFLITQSWTREPRLGLFTAKRALRIMPALVAVSVLTAYLLGPLVTTLSPGNYLTAPLTHAYVLRNVTLRTDYLLPGVFVHNPYPWIVNGSLWTLPIEVRAYVAVAVVGLVTSTLLGRRRHASSGVIHRFARVGLAFLVVVGVAAVALKVTGAHLAAYGISLPSRGQLTGGIGQQLPLFLVFGAGALLYICRGRVWLRWDVAVALIALWVAESHWRIGPDALTVKLLPALVFPYATLVVAFRGSQLLRRLTSRGDISYGLYVWAFPIGQTVALGWGKTVTPAILIALALPLSCLAAIASWLAVERPCLRLKPRASHPVPPAGDPGHLAIAPLAAGAASARQAEAPDVARPV